jgi:tRNA threonylcarbamoyladenosine biosynthesis protein TsaB
MILAVETSGDLCSVAVRDAQGTLIERTFRHRMHLSERLIDDVDAVLKDAGTTLDDLTGLAVDLGPGSFTGIRIGVMLVKTWADVLKKPVVGVTAFDALAEEYAGTLEGYVIPLIRARPGLVYASVYRITDGSVKIDTPPVMAEVVPLAGELWLVPKGTCVVCGDGAQRYRAEMDFMTKDKKGRPLKDRFFGAQNTPRASTIAAIAERRIAAGQTDDPLALVPYYIAPPPIDPTAEKRAAQAATDSKTACRVDRLS